MSIKRTLEKLPFYNQAVLPYHFMQSVIALTKYHHPAKRLRVIGVTGTNGKTTTCFMLWQTLRHAGFKAGLMTTVDAFTLNQRIKSIADAGAEFLVLEVTSHALAEFRTLGIDFELAIFTNLSHDHLDYHKTFAAYRDAKGKLFRRARLSILNADDSATPYYQTLSKKYITYGIKSGDFRAKSIKLGVSGVKYSCGDMNITTQIPGEFNVYNSLAAALAAKELGLTATQIESGINSLTSVEGRMTIIDEGQPFTVIVDYAHAPDALEKVFDSIPHDRKGKVITVHGGAGRRDPSTRAIRGRILAKYSDLVIITEDDSRDEDPEAIAAEFIKGATEQGRVLGRDLIKELDRKKAIALALSSAHHGDIVLILGKGHEKSILRADGPHPFSDIEVTRNLLSHQ